MAETNKTLRLTQVKSAIGRKRTRSHPARAGPARHRQHHRAGGQRERARMIFTVKHLITVEEI